MFKLQWLYFLALLRTWWDYLFSTELVPVTSKKPSPFIQPNPAVNWMDLSNNQCYGNHIHQHWCDPNTIDSDEHHRQFSDRSNRDTFYPQGQTKWFVGHHWRDYLFRPFMFHFNPLVEPRPVAYDLGYPSYRAMNECYKYLANQGKDIMFTISKGVLRGMAVLSCLLVFAALVVYSCFLPTEKAQAQAVQPQYPQAQAQFSENFFAEQVVNQNRTINQLIASQKELQRLITYNQERQHLLQTQLIDRIETLETQLDQLETARSRKSYRAVKRHKGKR